VIAAPQHRLASAAAAATCSLLVLGTVVGLFDHASRDDWLAGTDAQLAEVHRCKLASPDASHHACVQQVLAATRGGPAGSTRVAEAGGALPAATR
jgi:hypothetical protein